MALTRETVKEFDFNGKDFERVRAMIYKRAGMLAGNPAEFVPGNSITLYTVGPTQADTWTFLVEAEETITVSTGNLPTLKLSRRPRGDFDQKVEVWFAPSLDYLPVKSRITEQSGDFVEQLLESAARP